MAVVSRYSTMRAGVVRPPGIPSVWAAPGDAYREQEIVQVAAPVKHIFLLQDLQALHHAQEELPMPPAETRGEEGPLPTCLVPRRGAPSVAGVMHTEARLRGELVALARCQTWQQRNTDLRRGERSGGSSLPRASQEPATPRALKRGASGDQGAEHAGTTRALHVAAPAGPVRWRTRRPPMRPLWAPAIAPDMTSLEKHPCNCSMMCCRSPV